MRYIGSAVEQIADAVPAVRPHDGEAVGMGMFGYDIADLSIAGARTADGDGLHQALVRHSDQTLALFVYLPNHKRLVQVPMPAVQEDRDVHIDDVSRLQGAPVRDPVTDHLIDGGAHAFWEVEVVVWARVGTSCNRRLMNLFVVD